MNKKIILTIIAIFFSLLLFSQVQPNPPDNIITGNAKITGTLTINDIPIVTYDTYQLVSDSSGKVGYYGNPPTITINLNKTLVEFGTINTITVSGYINNPISATLTSPHITDSNTGEDVIYIIVTNNYSKVMPTDFSPTETGVTNNTYTSFITWDIGSSQTEISASKIISSCYPYFYGITEDDLTNATGTTIYIHSDLTKVIKKQTTLTLTFIGVGYQYVITPGDWDDLTSVTDATGAPVTGFTKSVVEVESTTTNVWTKTDYKCWKGATSGSYTGQTYTFKFSDPN